MILVQKTWTAHSEAGHSDNHNLPFQSHENNNQKQFFLILEGTNDKENTSNRLKIQLQLFKELRSLDVYNSLKR
jgi:hypothetical protein